MILLENRFNDIVSEAVGDGANRRHYLSGIFMESERQNRNGRTYKRDEIENAVSKVNEAATAGRHILGELDHPNGTLEVKLENAAIRIESMQMDGNNAIGRAKVLSTPKGQIVKALLDDGVQLGVSSRGSGSVQESTGTVENFELVTVDVVANPSAIDAFPQSVFESLQLHRQGKLVENLAEAVLHDQAAQKYFAQEIQKFIQSLRA